MSRHLVTTPVGVRACPRCDAIVLTGVAEGVPAHVDPHPVTVDAELAALVAGRWTYTLTRTGLVHRTVNRVRTPAGPVLVAHACPVVAQPPTTVRSVTVAQPATVAPGPCVAQPTTQLDPVTRNAVLLVRQILAPDAEIIATTPAEPEPPPF